MQDEFLVRAAFAAVGVALVAGPLGCFVVWRRMANFGDALSHSALLGVALAILAGVELYIGVAIAAGALALVLGLSQRQSRIPPETIISIAAHTVLALGLVAAAFVPNASANIMSYLFGDVLAASWQDVGWIWIGGLVVIGTLLFIWRSLLALTIDADLAAIEGIPVTRMRVALMLLLAIYIAIAIKLVGAVLAVSLLIVPAAAARRLSPTPEAMALWSAVIGTLSALGGLYLSVQSDAPAGPAIVVVALMLFMATSVLPRGAISRPS